MKAAILHALGQIPRCEDFPEPQPSENEIRVRVKAASLKNVDKQIAAGSHYHKPRELPAICGVDGVALLEDGTRVFCGGCRPPYGMMAERAVVARRFCLPIPEGIDDHVAAALPNPALSSWLALVWRAKLQPGETVLVLGATGVAGQLAIQVARHLGAGRVVAAGRNPRVLPGLPSLGADAVVDLGQSEPELTAAFVREGRQRFDVVLDYVWGRPTEALLHALAGDDLKAENKSLRWIQIGEAAGPTISLSASALRSAGIEIHGSGGGNVPHTAIFETFPKMWALAAAGKLRIETTPVPLAEIEQAWPRDDLRGRRIVVVP